MTLEKLLILGFALAVVTAIAVTSSGMVEKRKPEYQGYKGKVTDMIDKTR